MKELFEQAMALSRGGAITYKLEDDIIDYREILDYISKKRSLKVIIALYSSSLYDDI